MPMDSNNPYLPQEIIINIFKRLHLKSLIRFQCVCKDYKNLIKSPYFIIDHLHHSTHHQNYSILFQWLGPYHPLGWCFLDQEMQVVKAQSKALIGSLSGVRIIGSINGLICFQTYKSSIFLWNPVTREVRKVYEAVNISEPSDFRTGFGFSSIISDYKVVRIHVVMVNRRIIHSSEERSLCAHQVNQVHVYSLSTWSWNEIEFRNIDGVSLMSDGFPANGAIYWFGFMLSVGEQDDNDRHLVISFDIATEVFTLIPLPSSVPKSLRNRFAVYENKLAILCHTTLGNAEFSSIDLWVMDEGIGESGRWNWTKKYSARPYPYLLRPGTILRNEIVCNFLVSGATKHEENDGEGKVVLINISTNEFKTFAIPKYGDCGGLFFNYMESLVSIGNN